MLTEHLKPTPSVAMERCKFHQTRQQSDESIADFAARLKRMSLHCDFGANLKSALHDQLVCGIRDENLRIKLFEDSSLDYDKAIKTAAAHESAVKNASSAVNMLENKSKSEVFS